MVNRRLRAWAVAPIFFDRLHFFFVFANSLAGKNRDKPKPELTDAYYGYKVRYRRHFFHVSLPIISLLNNFPNSLSLRGTPTKQRAAVNSSTLNCVT